MADINKIFEDFLEDTVNLNPSRFEKVEKAEDTLSKFVKNSDTFKDLYVGATLQGSARQKTIIKPVGDDDEFDVDLLIMLKENTEWSPAEYHSKLVEIFKDSDRYEDITDTRGKTRCVTIDYNSDFHVDLVPAIERDGQVFIFNKSTDDVERTDGDGYAQWFEKQDSYAGGYLVPIVRLLKYLRDSRCEFDTKSVILTTVAAMQIELGDNFDSLPEAFAVVTERMDAFFADYDEAPTIQNPAMPDEDFDRHWKDDDKGYEKLKKALGSYSQMSANALGESDNDKALGLWQKLFGNEFKETETSEPTKAVVASVVTATRSFEPSGPYAE